MAEKKDIPQNIPGPGRALTQTTSPTDENQLQALIQIRDLLQDPVGIESSFAGLGCIFDATGAVIGRAMACKKADSDGVVTGVEVWAIYPGQAPVPNYMGQWSPCPAVDVCEPTTPRGVLTSWN